MELTSFSSAVCFQIIQRETESFAELAAKILILIWLKNDTTRQKRFWKLKRKPLLVLHINITSLFDCDRVCSELKWWEISPLRLQDSPPLSPPAPRHVHIVWGLTPSAVWRWLQRARHDLREFKKTPQTQKKVFKWVRRPRNTKHRIHSCLRFVRILKLWGI